jgi:hypothetical protein
MYRIFISYRRSDSESFSGRLRDRLRAEFGKRSVFLDTTTIPGGARFDTTITQNLSGCKVVVAVIGKTWLTCVDDQGNRRIDNPQDWVRQELALALKNENALVIPVVFGGAAMPRETELPADLKELHRRNAVSIADGDFDSDVARLIAACEPHVPRPRRWPWIAAAALLLAVCGGIYLHYAARSEFRGVYLVPGPGFAGSLPAIRSAARKKRYYLSFAVDGKRFGIQDLTRKSIFIVSDAAMDAPKGAQDVAELKTEIAAHFKSKGGVDSDAIAASLSSEPVVVSTLKVRPGAKINAEIGIAEADAAGGVVRQLKARCDFTVPDAPTNDTLLFYVARSSAECKPAG